MMAPKYLRGSSMLNMMAFLLGEPERTVRDKSGLCGRIITDAIGQNVTRMGKLYDAGFIEYEMRGRRVYRVTLTNAGVDELMAWREKVTWKAPKPFVPISEMKFEGAEEPLELPPADPVFTELEESGRPGRVAARIERTIPDLVQVAVKEAVFSLMTEYAARLGFVQKVDETELRELTTKFAVQQDQLAGLVEELRVERQLANVTREELNRLLSRHESGRVSGGAGLTPNDIAEPWRELASEAITAGWKLKRTGGGHIAWIAPNGGKCFGPSTPSDWRSVRNHRSDMKKYGFGSEVIAG